MNWISSWFKTNNNQVLNGSHKHSTIVYFCCSDFCNVGRQVCSECSSLHQGHILLNIKQFKRNNQLATKDIQWRKKLQGAVRQFHQNLVASLQSILQKQTQKFMADIDDKVYNKNFMEIYKRYLTGRSYYSCLQNYQASYGQDFYGLLQKNIKQKQQKLLSSFKLIVEESKFLINQDTLLKLPNVRDGMISHSKVDKIKSLMPFHCHLTPKFQASKHRFQTSNLHKLGLRGPILLVAESYKGKIFGGFSPKMFPKHQCYEEDNRGRSFLFSLDHRVRLPIQQEYKKFAIKGGNNLWFGRGDLVIADECNKGNISWAQIGRAYKLPSGITGNVDQWLGGALYFQIIQYQIYEVQTSFLTR